MSLGPLPHIAGEQILRAAALLDGMLAEVAGAEGLTALELRLLRTVADEVPQGVLARRLQIDPARVSVLTAGLEARGLLLRVPSTGDRRHRVPKLTDAGISTVRRIGALLVARSPLQHLAADELDQLITLLGRVAPPAGPADPAADRAAHPSGGHPVSPEPSA